MSLRLSGYTLSFVWDGKKYFPLNINSVGSHVVREAALLDFSVGLAGPNLTL